MNTREHARFGSVGVPRKGVTIKVVNLEGLELPADRKGQIIAHSSRPNLFFSGYWKKPEITDEMLAGGWLHTGDLGWMDEDGFLYFGSRLKELIRRAGEMISPVEIELQLLKHPAIRDCAVIGIPDEILGEEIKAFVVPAEDIDLETVPDFLRGKIPDHMIPHVISVIEEIPKTETQKIKRHVLASHVGPQVDLRVERTLEKKA